MRNFLLDSVLNCLDPFRVFTTVWSLFRKLKVNRSIKSAIKVCLTTHTLTGIINSMAKFQITLFIS